MRDRALRCRHMPTKAKAAVCHTDSTSVACSASDQPACSSSQSENEVVRAAGSGMRHDLESILQTIKTRLLPAEPT